MREPVTTDPGTTHEGPVHPGAGVIARRVEQWQAAGVIDAATAGRIRAWEDEHASRQESRLGRLAFVFGGALLAAGILLFVAAHWTELAPWSRFALLMATVAGMHLLAGAVQARAPALAVALHAVGTVALGAAIFLAGQTFHLAERWPTGFLLWSLGAAWALWWLRDAVHVVFVAVLVPAWLVTEWSVRVGFDSRIAFAVTAAGLFVLGTAYLAAVGPEARAPWRAVLARLGAVLVVWAGAALPFAAFERNDVFTQAGARTPGAWVALGWGVAALAPLALGFALRGRAAWPLVLALGFALVVTQFDAATASQRLVVHLLYLLAAVGLTLWGVREAHGLRVNVGVLAFAGTVLSFYYSSVFDKIGRSLGLVALGVIFLGGGWLLERTRRRLLRRIDGERDA